ncbi:MAG: hypothetical protein NVSMB62_11610 [Acidobacteriaceae bacterium]
MQIVLSPLRFLALSLAFAALGCHAQTAAPAPSSSSAAVGNISPDLARRIEVMIRSHSEIPADYVMAITERRKSEIPGYDQISVVFSTKGNASRPINFLLSEDTKTLARWDKFDLSKDPRDKVSPAGRPGRGGPENAPVMIVGFDDLQCPYCAKMHAQLFPALTERYGKQVRIVYRDFPLGQHPWAIHAAVDANCLAAENPVAYWSYVDRVHVEAGEIGGSDRNLAKAQTQLDKIATDEGAKAKINGPKLESCLKKQDDTAVRDSVKQGETLGIDATPALFVNGEKVEGAIPMEYLFRIIDQALVAAGQTPPPPYVPPVAAPAPAPANPSSPANKPGN